MLNCQWNYNAMSGAITATWVNYDGFTYTGSWGFNSDVSTVAGYQLSLTGPTLPSGAWTPVVSIANRAALMQNVIFSPTGTW